MSGIITDNVGRASGLLKSAGGGGKILQIQTVTQPAVVTATPSSSWTSWSGTTVTITPIAANSKFYLTGQLCQMQANDSSVRVGRTIDGGSVAGCDIVGNQIGSSRPRATSGGNQFRTAHEIMQSSISGIDDPTYDLGEVLTYMWQAMDADETMYLNREYTDVDETNDCTGVTTLTVMEIATT